jgi:hypothetical protein
MPNRTEATKETITIIENWCKDGLLPTRVCEWTDQTEVDETLVFRYVSRLLGYVDFLENQVDDIDEEYRRLAEDYDELYWKDE